MANPQQFSGFPLSNSQLVDDHGRITQPWLRFLLALWTQLGAGTVPISGGFIAAKGTRGGSEEPQLLVASPFNFTATIFGTLIVSHPYSINLATGERSVQAVDCSTEMQRPPSALYHLVGFGLAVVPLVYGDHARVSWVGSTPPLVTWLPVQS